MSRLYPPNINGTIPAFYGTTLVVPFSLSRAINALEIYGVQIKIKTISGIVKETLNAVKYEATSNCYASFSLKEKYEIGQYYKVQIAFIDSNGIVGYYSTVGVVKCTTQPKISIEGMEFRKINPHTYSYTGVYSQLGQDTTEKMYSSRFKVYNDAGMIIDDTGDILHNSTTDVVPYESTEKYTFEEDLEENMSFYIQYSAVTVNGLEVKSPRYRISQKKSVSTETKFNLKANLKPDDGFIELKITDCEKDLLSGTFLVSRRSSSDNNDNHWSEFKRFSLHAVKVEDFVLSDCTIAHGIEYTYSIQQYNQNGLYSQRVISNTVLADFEDAFLFDGEKQLRIRYNPKVSSFKIDYADQKTDTIGSQHPFIVRNGNMAYREFPISGLISYKMDEDNEMFMSMKELGLVQSATNLTSENIAAERIFKMAVLDWLNNGKPKLFRSPAEGNFIVRLMNVSLTPNDTLGRMLHTFNATAYEIAGFTTNNLSKYSIIDATENIEEQVHFASIQLNTLYDKDRIDKKIQLNNNQRNAYSVTFIDMLPNSIVYLDDESVMIGATGYYYATSEKGFSYVGIRASDIGQGICTYSFKARSISMFGMIDNLAVQDTPVRQFIGNKSLHPRGLYRTLQDIRTELVGISVVRFIKRPIDYLYVDINLNSQVLDTSRLKISNLFYDMDCREPVTDLRLLDPLTTYQLRARRDDYRNFRSEQYYVDKNTTYFAPYSNYYLDGLNAHYDNSIICYEISSSIYNISIDSEIINIDEQEKYLLEKPDQFSTITFGNGIICEIGYSSQIISYSFENDNEDVKNVHERYDSLLTEYQSLLADETTSIETLKKKKTILDNAYNNYINVLNKAIENYKEAYGIE